MQSSLLFDGLRNTCSFTKDCISLSLIVLSWSRKILYQYIVTFKYVYNT